MSIWISVIGMVAGLLIGILSLFVGAWVYKQDHPVPIGIFGMVMYLMGIATVLGLWFMGGD